MTERECREPVGNMSRSSPLTSIAFTKKPSTTARTTRKRMSNIPRLAIRTNDGLQNQEDGDGVARDEHAELEQALLLRLLVLLAHFVDRLDDELEVAHAAVGERAACSAPHSHALDKREREHTVWLGRAPAVKTFAVHELR